MNKKMFSQTNRDIIEVDTYRIVEFNFSHRPLDRLSFLREADYYLHLVVNDVAEYDIPILFRIKGNLKSFRKKEKPNHLLIVTNLFISHFFTEELLTHEQRLSPLKVLEKANISKLVKSDLDKRVLKFPVFGIEFVDDNDNLIHSVF